MGLLEALNKVKSEKFDPDESCINYAFLISTENEISKQLISMKSIDVNYKYFGKDNDYVYETPLTFAVKNNDIEKINMIIQHLTFDKVKSQLTSSIFESDKNNNLDIFKSLLNLIDNDVIFCNDKNASLLRAAVCFSSEKFFMMKFFIDFLEKVF